MRYCSVLGIKAATHYSDCLTPPQMLLDFELVAALLVLPQRGTSTRLCEQLVSDFQTYPYTPRYSSDPSCVGENLCGGEKNSESPFFLIEGQTYAIVL